MDLRNKGALLVGTRRVGERVAMRLADEGVNLAIVYRRSKDEAEKLQTTLASLVDKTALLQADLSSENDVRRIVDESAKQLGGLQFVINLASDYPRAPFDTLDSDSWDRAMATAKSSYLLAVHSGRMLSNNTGRSRGHIVMFSDWAAGESPYTEYLPYLTAKAAVDFMTRGFAKELAANGVQVNAIAPGPTMRPPEISEQIWQDDVLAKAPLKRESSPDDIAELIVALLKSETITGETIRIDSGRHLAGSGVD
jgi:NAD(P)-dependent dehydrogenase (short-subunit alcohol dehydrogenase family)